MLAIVALAFVAVTFFTFRRRAEIRATRELVLTRVFEDESVEVAVTIENAGDKAQFLEVRDEVPRQFALESGRHYAFLPLHEGEKGKLAYRARAPLLGVYAVGPLALRLEDPFGLFHEERTLPPAESVSVLPKREDLRKAALVSKLPMPLLGDHQVNQPGDGFDFFALREYVPGDVFKNINWKASARSGKLMVNQMERVTAAEATILFDARGIEDAGPEHETPFVASARAAASLSSWLLNHKDNVRLLYYSDELAEIHPAPAERLVPEILQTLAGMSSKGRMPLTHVVSRILPTLKPRSPVVLVSSCADDPDLVEGASVLLANEMILSVVAPKPHYPGADPAFAAALDAARERTLSALRAYGAFVVDLEPGASLATTLEAMGGLR
jgi:uncharacterized protein (DUF58 family)